jgi:hypothetical protein
MHNSPESVTYLVKVRHTVMINNEECAYDEIIAQCTDLDRAVEMADAANGKIEKLTGSVNNSALGTE